MIAASFISGSLINSDISPLLGLIIELTFPRWFFFLIVFEIIVVLPLLQNICEEEFSMSFILPITVVQDSITVICFLLYIYIYIVGLCNPCLISKPLLRYPDYRESLLKYKAHRPLLHLPSDVIWQHSSWSH